MKLDQLLEVGHQKKSKQQLSSDVIALLRSFEPYPHVPFPAGITDDDIDDEDYVVQHGLDGEFYAEPTYWMMNHFGVHDSTEMMITDTENTHGHQDQMDGFKEVMQTAGFDFLASGGAHYDKWKLKRGTFAGKDIVHFDVGHWEALVMRTRDWAALK